MDRLLQSIQNLWIRAQLESPPFVRRTVIPRLHELKEMARLVVKPRLPVYELTGQGYGGPLTVTYAGLDYAKPFLKSILFVNEPTERYVASVPFWRCDRVSVLSQGDIVIIEAAKHLIRRLPLQAAFVMPQFVHYTLNLEGTWPDVESRLHKSARRELRRTQRQGYQYETSHDDRDFATFYHDMYLPTMDVRHGELSSPMSFAKAYQHFRHGLLFYIILDGRRVCASVFYLDQGIVNCMIVGVTDGDQELMRQGATAALNALRIQWANAQGYKAINFLGTDPHMKSGLFQYKRKWGTMISIPSYLHRHIWIKVQRVTPGVSHFLTDNPFIVLDPNGKLHGLIVVEDAQSVSAETRQEWQKQYATPGLDSFYVRSVHSFDQVSCNVDDPRCAITIPMETLVEG